jgi:hypothetical protein
MPESAANTRNPAFARSRTRRPSLAMHSSQCSICRHPERAEIERAFLDWTSPGQIARDFDLGCRTTVYRHAHALGLFARRERSLRFALGRLIERVDEVKPTATSIVSAIRLMAKLNARRDRDEEPSETELQDLPDTPALETPTNEPEEDATHQSAATSDAGYKNEKRGAEYGGPPIGFAQTVLHRRKLFWR